MTTRRVRTPLVALAMAALAFALLGGLGGLALATPLILLWLGLQVREPRWLRQTFIVTAILTGLLIVVVFLLAFSIGGSVEGGVTDVQP